MAASDNSRVVYSSTVGRMCPDCRLPARDCQCRNRAADAPVPVRIMAKLRIEKAGRGGKTVSVVDGLPHNAAFLKDLCQGLKRACGTGGSVVEGTVEVQGDLRDRIREFLLKKGFGVKG